MSVMWLSSALVCKTAERIEVLFGVNGLRCPRNTVLDGGHDLAVARGDEVHSMRLLPSYFGISFVR